MNIDKIIWAILLSLLALCIWVCLSSCYTEKTARNRFHKVAAMYPIIPAEYCDDKFPCKDSVNEHIEYVKGDPVIFTDTTIQVIRDTVYMRLRTTVTHVDTVHTNKIVYQTDKAALNLSELRLQEMTVKNQNNEQGVDKLVTGRNTWRWIGIGLIAAICIGIALMIFRK